MGPGNEKAMVEGDGGRLTSLPRKRVVSGGGGKLTYCSPSHPKSLLYGRTVQTKKNKRHG